MSSPAQTADPPAAVTDLPGVGAEVASQLTDDLDLDEDDLAGLVRSFFGSDGRTVADVVSDADSLVVPLLRAARTRDIRFAVPRDQTVVLETMAFVRLFCPHPRFLTGGEREWGTFPDGYAVSPSDIDWEDGVVADRFDVAAVVHNRVAAIGHSIDLNTTTATPHRVTHNPHNWVAYHANGHRSLVDYEYVGELGELLDRDFLTTENLSNVAVNEETDDYFVTFSSEEWLAHIILAPKILSE